jgi:hypothetical protein
MMTITLQISPETESALRSALSRQDLPTAQQLLAGAAVPQLEALMRSDAGETEALSAQQARALDRQAREARDLEILNRHADELNCEAQDFLALQADW